MPSRAVISALVASVALVLAGAAAAAGKQAKSCPEGQVDVNGACAPACATDKAFEEPHNCECPAGYGKIFLGSGGGECRRLVCKADAVVDPAQCDCPAGKVKKPAGKGHARCVAEVAHAKAR